MNRHPRARGRRSAFALTATGGAAGRCRTRRSRTGRRRGVQPPGGTAHLGDAAVRHDRPLRVPQPGARRTRSRWSPTGSRSRSRPAVRTSTAFATDARYDINVDNNGGHQARRDYRWTFKDHYRQQEHLPVRHGSGDLAQRREPELLPDLPAGRIARTARARCSSRTSRSRRPTSARRRCRTTPRCARRRDRRSPEKQRQVLRRSGRGPVLPRPAGLRPALRRRPSASPATTPWPGFNVNSVALQVPAAAGSPRRATPRRTRSSASGRRPTEQGVNGKYHQVSRLGNPLVNEVVIPLKDKDRFNASKPSQGHAVPRLRHQAGAAEARSRPSTASTAPKSRATTSCRCSSPVSRASTSRRASRPSEQLRLNMSTPVTAEPEPARRDRWRQPGLPERAAPG